MNDAILFCRDERRRHNVRASQSLNGLDYLEVSDDQLVLKVYFLKPVPADLKKENVIISGGRRITDIKIKDITSCQNTPIEPDCLQVSVDKVGDFSTYTLKLVSLDESGRVTDEPFNNLDPRYAKLDFNFKSNCPSDFDCKARQICPQTERIEPDINYLARDFSSLRQTILDRLAQTMPDWKERHLPDLGITLVEVLAYVGDYLSYYQDAVATEAYLKTARQRISIRRHARLVDYTIHEGCNARAWVAVDTSQDQSFDPKNVFFTTRLIDIPMDGKVLNSQSLLLPANRYEVFEPLIQKPVATLFTKDDIYEPKYLAAKLKTPQDPLSQYVSTQLSTDTRDLLEQYVPGQSLPEALFTALINDFNQLLYSGNLYKIDRFVQVVLTEETRQLVGQNPIGDDLIRLNRWLLEEGYHQAILWSQRGFLYFYASHNEIHFYTWDDLKCCLPRGATTATLRDEWMQKQAHEQTEHKTSQSGQPSDPLSERKLHLKVGDVLIFVEVLGPDTGNEVDADSSHRQAVRLTRVEPGVDELHNQPIVEIEWAHEDALLFPLCISTIGPAPDCLMLEDISVVYGNIVLVDHGRRVENEQLDEVVEKERIYRCKKEGRREDVVILPAIFNPYLQETPLTFSQPLPDNAAASELIVQDVRKAMPQIWLKSSQTTPVGVMENAWIPKPDLFSSRSMDCHFVVEMDNDGQAHLRFGDDDLGQMPEAGTDFQATYRIGNGLAGNVGAETISHVILRGINPTGTTLKSINPMPAQGGLAPESLDAVKLFAPTAFRKQLERAITAEDYARLAERHPRVQRAAAAFRWMGSWYKVLVAIDPLGNVEADQSLLDEVARSLFRYRRMGHDLVVQGATYVPLDIAMTVCVQSGYLRGHVKQALLNVFSNQLLLDGKGGFFHPDNWTFGQSLQLSKLVALAQDVPGVESIVVTKMERLFEGPNNEIENGILPLNFLEIARLDNDPNFPENGRLELIIQGGQ